MALCRGKGGCIVKDAQEQLSLLIHNMVFDDVQVLTAANVH